MTNHQDTRIRELEEALIEKLEAAKYSVSMSHPRGLGFNEGIDMAIHIITTRAPTNQGEE